MCLSVVVCLYDSVVRKYWNSLACEIRIVNDITDCKTCLFNVSGLFVLFCFRTVCVRVCVYVFECVRAFSCVCRC